MQRFACHGLYQTYICMPDEARDGQNVALKFLSDCWRTVWAHSILAVKFLLAL